MLAMGSQVLTGTYTWGSHDSVSPRLLGLRGS